MVAAGNPYLVCKMCGHSYKKKLNLDGTPRVNQPAYCNLNCRRRSVYYADIEASRRKARQAFARWAQRQRSKPIQFETRKCIVCASAFQYPMTRKGAPRKRPLNYCSDRCVNVKRRQKPTERQCIGCGKLFKPKKYHAASYCTRSCNSQTWIKAHPEKAVLYAARHAKRTEEQRNQYEQARLRVKQRRLLTLLRRILRRKKKDASAQRMRTCTCRQCGSSFLSMRSAAHCSRLCAQLTERLGKKTAKAKDVAELRDSYVVSKLRQMGIAKIAVVPTVMHQKRQQLLLHRSIKATKHVIRKSIESNSPKN